MIRNSAFIIGLILGALGFCALPLYGQTPESSNQPITPIMRCLLLKPSYRGLSFDDESKTQIEALVQLNLQGWGLSLDDVSLYARFGNPALRDITIKKSILDLKSQELKVNFEVEALPINEYTLAISLRRKNAETEFLDEQLAFKAFKIKRMPAIERQKMAFNDAWSAYLTSIIFINSHSDLHAIILLISYLYQLLPYIPPL